MLRLVLPSALKTCWPTALALLVFVGLLVRLGPLERGEVESSPRAPVSAHVTLSVLAVALPRCAGQVDAGPCSQKNEPAPDAPGVGPASVISSAKAAPRPAVPLPGVPGASVRLLAEHGRDYLPFADVQTDGLGKARVDAPKGTYYCLVEAPGRARSAQRIVLGDGGLELRVVLEEALALNVAVRDESNRPIAGATVLVHTAPVAGADELPQGALTAADGLASFAHVGAGVESLRVTARGFDSAVLEPAARDVNVTLSVPAELAVSVVDGRGAAVAGAEVWLAGFDVWPPRQAQTGADGVARLKGLSHGTYDLRARRDQLVSTSLVGLVIQRGERASVTLSLEPGRFVSVQVTDAALEQQPIAAADVVLAEDGLTPFPLQGRTDSSGRLTLGPLPARPATLSVRADGFVPESGMPIGANAGSEVQVALVRGGRLTGEIVDSEGFPVEGARLEVVGNDWRGRPIARHSGSANVPRGFFERSLGPPLPLVPMGELGVMPGPLPLPGMPALGAPSGGSWQSDLDGKYELHDVPPGRLRVLVRHPDFVETLSAVAALEPGGQQSLRIVLERGAALEGRVADELGRPVEGARVDAIAAHGTQERSVLTRADGSFAFGAVAAEVDLFVARPDDRHHFVLRRSLQLQLGQTLEIELTLPAERAQLLVNVKDDTDEPLEGARVLLLSLDPGIPFRQTAYSDSSGQAEFEDAAGMHATLRVQAAGFDSFEAELDAAPTRVEVALERGVLVTGRITQLRGREPLSDAEVVLVQDGERRVARSDSDGAYTFADVAPGPVRISISHPEFAPRTLTETVRVTSRADRPFELASVELEAAGAVSGVVLDPAGAPVPNARVGVGIVPAFLPAGAAPDAFIRSGPDGRFSLQGVPVGRTKIAAYAVGVGRGESEVEVIAGETSADAEIRLRGGQADAESAALANVAVTLGERTREGQPEVVIVDVAAGSEAERSGLREGDVLTSIDGMAVLNMGDARHRLGGGDGSDVILQLGRTGTVLSVRVRREPVRR